MIISISNIIGSTTNLQRNPAFKITVDTTQAGSASDTFVLPLASGETYNFDIAWGDGSSETVTSDTDVTHVYPSAGTYQIRIEGAIPRVYFNNSGDKAKLISIDNFGTYAQGSTNQQAAFRGCSNLVISATDTGYFGSVTDFSFSWYGCSSLTSFPSLDTSSGTNFILTWYGCSSLTSFPQIDTSNVTIFNATWQSCSGLTSFPLLDTSSSTTFSSAWRSCSSLTTFPANAFDSNTNTNYTNAFLNTDLSTQSIDDILVSLDTCGVLNGTFTQSGGQAPSATGESAIDSLVGKGWTITVTGGYSGLGPELVTNGTFDTDSDWSFIGTANINGGVAIFPDSTVSYLIQGPVIPLTVKTYKLQYEVVSTNGSNFRLSGGNSAFGTVTLDSSTVGVKTVNLTSNGTTMYLQFNNNAFIGSIDNVSVKEKL